MTTQIKITQLTNIGSANTTVTTLLPVVNMAGTPTTQKTTLGNLANVILSQSGGNYAPANLANIAYSVANAEQPNITSVGTLTNLAVSGNATVNGNLTSNGTAYLGNISTTGLASITTLSVGATANLGAVGNVKITGGTAGQVLSTDGAGNLSWASDSGGNYGNSNVVSLLSAFGSNTITTTGNVSVGNIIGNGQALTGITGANVSGFVPNANVANTAFAVAAANVSGLGNIATANFDGNASNVLHGDGSWSADTTTYGNSNVATFLAAYGSNTITTTGNVTVGNLSTNGIVKIGNATITEINPIVLGFTDDIYVDGDVLSQRLKSNTGTVALNASNSTADTEWAFNVNGTLNLPQPVGNNSTSIQSIYGNTNSFVDFVSNNSANFTFGTTANNNIVLITGLNENDNRWVFGYNGNLTLPGNTFAVNYANGTQVSLGGGGGGNSISDGTSNVSVVSSDGNVVIGIDNDIVSWTFATDSSIYSKAETDFKLVMTDPNEDGYGLQQIASDGTQELAKTVLELDRFAIFTNLDGAGEEWRFNGNTLQVSTNSTIRGFDSDVVIESMYAGGNGTASLRSVSNVNDPNVFTTIDATTTGANIKVYNGGSNGGVEYAWQFDNDGNLTLPGNTVAINFANGAAAVGNIVSVNLDGSSSNVLYGNGVFATAPSSTYGNSNVATFLGSYGSNTISTTGNIAVGAVTASGKIGYSAGANVTQTTSRSTSVTINALSGEITLFASSMTGGQVDFFTMTNNQVAAGDMIVCATYGGSLGTYLPMAYVSSDTQAVFTVRNLDTFVSAAESPVIKFIVIKAPNA